MINFHASLIFLSFFPFVISPVVSFLYSPVSLLYSPVSFLIFLFLSLFSCFFPLFCIFFLYFSPILPSPIISLIYSLFLSFYSFSCCFFPLFSPIVSLFYLILLFSHIIFLYFPHRFPSLISLIYSLSFHLLPLFSHHFFPLFLLLSLSVTCVAITTETQVRWSRVMMYCGGVTMCFSCIFCLEFCE